MRLLSWLILRIVGLFGLLRGPSIKGFSPRFGWLGSLVTIEGERFATGRDANAVKVSGVDALVINADRESLRVLIGEGSWNRVTIDVSA